MCEQRGVRICCYESPHAEAFGSCLRPFHTVSEGKFSEVPHSLCPGVVGSSVANKIGGDHGLLERRRTAAACQRAGAEEDRRGLAHAEGRWYREVYELGNGLLLAQEGGCREARPRTAARANRRRSQVHCHRVGSPGRGSLAASVLPLYDLIHRSA